MAEVRWIENLEGVLYFLNTPILDFEIKNRRLVRADNLSEGRFFPPEFARTDVTYGAINDFFRRRTMREGSMFYREHLKAFGLTYMQFDKYIQLNNGNNHLDNYWVRFASFGAKSFEEMCNQAYPVVIA